MSSHASVWTPRHTTRLWPKPAGKTRFPFSPKISGPWHEPPPPPPLKRPPPKKAAPVEADQLSSLAGDLQSEADALEQNTVVKPSLRIQLGLLLLTKDDYIKKILKDWDTKGKGEFLKGEFRLNLRNTGINATSGEADELFDSWDDDRGGSLDLKELRAALLKCQDAAKAFKSTPDPNESKVAAMRQKAALAAEASEATAAAEEAEQELADLERKNKHSAAIRLGALLQRRKIRPGAVVTQWSTSKGEHAGELSKREFREAVIKLGLPADAGAEIDAVFDQYDEDGGGYMDAEEAKAMIRGLQKAADDADHDTFQKRQEAIKMRTRASRMASGAMAPLPSVAEEEEDDEPGGSPEPPPPPPKSPKGKKGGPKPGDKTRLTSDEASGANGKPPPPSLSLSGMVSGAVKVGLAAIEVLLSSHRGNGNGGGGGGAAKIDEAMLRAAKRLGKLSLSNGFNTWHDNVAEGRRQLDTLRRVVLKLRSPLTQRGWSTWAEYAGTRAYTLHAVRQAMHHWTMYREILLFRRWGEHAALQRRAQAVRNKALEAATFMTRPALKSALARWRRQQPIAAMDPDDEPGAAICQALRKCLSP